MHSIDPNLRKEAVALTPEPMYQVMRIIDGDLEKGFAYDICVWGPDRIRDEHLRPTTKDEMNEVNRYLIGNESKLSPRTKSSLFGVFAKLEQQNEEFINFFGIKNR
ncbi:MAG: hypothetical protein GXO64_05120 [Candidatus Micrarchaeota archaeon]|nr:hypothetical protein [Candidatus Micrarchaeota archaeon]